MNASDLTLNRLRAANERVYVRGYDEAADTWTFATDDPDDAPLVAQLDRANPKRAEIHKSLLDIIAGRSICREGVRLTVGEFPPKYAKNDVNEEHNLNEGRLQIVDMGEIELSPQARKVVCDGKIAGEWSKELERAVDRFADTKVYEQAYDVIYRLREDPELWRNEALPTALKIARRELGLGADDPRFSDEQIQAWMPRTADGAIMGPEGLPGERACVIYDTNRSLAEQSDAFREAKAMLQENDEAKQNGGPTLTEEEERKLVARLISASANYASQRAIVDRTVFECAGDKDTPSSLEKAEQILIRDGQLLYGHPKREKEDYSRASKEAARQLASDALRGVMALQADSNEPDASGGIAAAKKLPFHREVLGEMDANNLKGTLSPGDRLKAYLLLACNRLDRYSFRDRTAVYDEQVKAAAPDRRDKLTKPDPTKEKTGLDHLAISKAIEEAAKTGAGLIEHSGHVMHEIEHIGR